MNIVIDATHLVIIVLLLAVLFHIHLVMFKNYHCKMTTEKFANYGDAGCPAGTQPGVNQAGVEDCVPIQMTRRHIGN
jgi:hypothetical protein